jgi:hypothetical protein
MSDWNTIDADYELISLLNDFTIDNQMEQKNIQNNNLQGSTVKIKVFNDNSGLPTDNFLEELKKNNIDNYEDSSSDSNDIPYVYPRKDNVALLNTEDYENDDVSSEDSYSPSDNSSITSFDQQKYTKKKLNNFRNNNEMLHKSFTIRVDNRTKNNRTKNNIKSKREKVVSSITRNKTKAINFVKKNSIMPEPKINNENNFILSTSGAKIPNWPMRKSNSSISNMNSSNKLVKNSNNNKNNAINDYDTTYNQKNESKNLVSKYLEIPDQINSDQISLQNDNIESETKLRTLTLRLSGQKSSIKALETQLAEALQMLEIRNQEISQVNSRLRILEVKDKNKITKSTLNNNKHDGESYRLVVEDLEKCKVMSEIVENRHREEQVRRQRAEERVRLLKVHVDNSKQNHSEILLQKINLEKSNSDLQKRIMKCKKVIKEQAISFQSQLSYSKDKELELEMLRERHDKSELSLRHANIEIGHLREEFRLVKIDLNLAQEKNKHQSLILETVKEKDATRRTEQRLNDSETRLIAKRKSNIIEERINNINTSYSTSQIKEKIVDRNQNISKINKKKSNQNDEDDISSLNNQDETSIKQHEEMLSRLKERRNRLTTQAIQSQKRSNDYLEGKNITSDITSNSLAIPLAKMSLNNSNNNMFSKSNTLDNNQEALKPSKHFINHQQQQQFKLQEEHQFKNISKPNDIQSNNINNTLNPNNKQRYQRLQKMYEKCMKKDGTRLAWKGSDDDSESDH